jgi:hypothetical protein
MLGATAQNISVSTLALSVVGSLGVGAILAAIIGRRAERDQQLRDRMLEASDEFSQHVGRALVELWRLIHTTTLARAQRQREEFVEHVRAMESRVPRIQLLFGPESWAASWAAEIAGNLSFAYRNQTVDWMQALSGDLRDEREVERVKDAIADWAMVTEGQHTKFSRSAWRSIRRPGRGRFGIWWRHPLWEFKNWRLEREEREGRAAEARERFQAAAEDAVEPIAGE